MAARDSVSRREFGKTVAAAGVGLALPARGVFAAGSDTIRVAIVGCGERGTTDVVYCLKSAPGVELVAIADLFQDKVDASLEKLRAEVPGQIKVPPERIFLGFDAYEKVLALDDVDLVMLLTPPGFRPQMVAAAVEAGKHLFVEKPGAVDPVGIRSLIESSERAARKGLSLVVGTQQRYAPQYLELVQRIRDGQIGELTHLEALWIGDMELWHYHDRQPSWSDMEWQVRCWPLFTWLSGDHYVEQLVHNLDVVNWVADATPGRLPGPRRPAGPHRAAVRQHLRPLRGALRVRERPDDVRHGDTAARDQHPRRQRDPRHRGDRPRGPRQRHHRRREALGVRRRGLERRPGDARGPHQQHPPGQAHQRGRRAWPRPR